MRCEVWGVRCEVLTGIPDFLEIRPKYRDGSRQYQFFSDFRQEIEMKKPNFYKKVAKVRGGVQKKQVFLSRF